MLIIPVSDRDVVLLSLNKDLFKKINTKVLVCQMMWLNVCAVCFVKRHTQKK